MQPASLMEVLREAAASVRAVLDTLPDWGPAGTRPGQYRSDIVADEAALRVFASAGIAVLSEESGRTGAPGAPGRAGGAVQTTAGGLVAVLDPVDGSTNAARGIPWFATSICVVDDEGPLAALVANQATGTCYEAIRGEGATRDGRVIEPRGAKTLGRAVVGLSGYAPRHLGWRQYRALGAAALDLCAVADGTLDAYIDCGLDGHGVWDYLGGMLVCQEAGALVADAEGRDLVVLDDEQRRAPVAAATPELLEAVLEARKAAFVK
ncbi:MAG: inositol monophosphatase family protein [Acidimicrobiales bacterium]